MQTPLQLRWHGLDPSDAIAGHVGEEVARLERFWDRIVGCVVTLETPSRHHRHTGTKYRVRIELSVPGARLVVGRDPPKTWKHTDLYVAVKEAFREAQRRLEDHLRRLDGRVKRHTTQARGEVARIEPIDGFGFLRTPDGREIYFHERSVLNGGFRRLRVGSVVRFAEEAGDEGPQASTVTPVGRRRRKGAAAREPRGAPVPD
jgi:cold shock CspA family protein